MQFPLAVYLIYFTVGLSAMLIQSAALRAFRVRTEVIQIFYGQPLASVDLGSTRLQLGWIPLGCFTSYDIQRFALLPTVLRVCLHLLPTVILVGGALSVLGPAKGWHHFVTGFREMVEGLLHPQTVGYVLLEKLHALYRQSPLEVAGVLAAKSAAWSLLPVGHVMISALREIFSPTLRRREGFEKLISFAMLLGFLGSLAWMGIFLVYAVQHWAA